jgi:hypothetical protein
MKNVKMMDTGGDDDDDSRDTSIHIVLAKIKTKS